MLNHNQNNNYVMNLVNLISALPTGLDTKQQLLTLITPKEYSSHFHSQSLMSIMSNIPNISNNISPPLPPNPPSLQSQSIQSLSTIPDTLQIQTNGYHEINVNTSDNNNANDSITSSTLSANTICPVTVDKCKSINSIIKFNIYRSKYNVKQINNIITKCEEFKNISDDYQHYITSHSINDDKLKIDQISKQYEKIYDFIKNFNKNTNNNNITIEEIEQLNKTMNKIYIGMQSNINCDDININNNLNDININNMKLENKEKENNPNNNICDHKNAFICSELKTEIESSQFAIKKEPISHSISIHKPVNININNINNIYSAAPPPPIPQPIPLIQQSIPSIPSPPRISYNPQHKSPKLPTYDTNYNNQLKIPQLQSIPPINQSIFKNTPQPIHKNRHKVLDFKLRIVSKKK
eukprot:750232_1